MLGIPPKSGCCRAAHPLLYGLQLCHSARDRHHEGLGQLPPELLCFQEIYLPIDHLSIFPSIFMYMYTQRGTPKMVHYGWLGHIDIYM